MSPAFDAHRRLVGDLKRFQAAAASASRTVGAEGSTVRARLRDEAAAWQAALDLLSDPGVYVIAVERRRQVEEEGWAAEVDAGHTLGQLAGAAAAYATYASRQEAGVYNAEPGPGVYMPEVWPWDRAWWKPKGPVRNLERAGALVAAEIGRLVRKASREDRA